ncbi:hypothetical protein [Coxiella burnetii]|uniref:hypothetical protein n=1 Tax=Coxiella burnetii TaxID=777 RepID=UPI0009B7F2BF|nr:hypothetical protein [Coxiella burnetii]
MVNIGSRPKKENIFKNQEIDFRRCLSICMASSALATNVLKSFKRPVWYPMEKRPILGSSSLEMDSSFLSRLYSASFIEEASSWKAR